MNNFIFDYLKNKYVQKYISHNYGYLTKNDMLKLDSKIPKVLEFVNLDAELKEVVSEGNAINMDGFIMFRLIEIKKFLNTIIDDFAENLILDKKFSELIRLIKFYLISNKYNSDRLEIYFHSDNSISINLKGSVGANRNFFDKDLLIEDFLFECIIDNAPKELIVHNVNYIFNREFVKILYMLYGSRLKLCSGCSKCLHMHFERNI